MIGALAIAALAEPVSRHEVRGVGRAPAARQRRCPACVMTVT